MKKKRYSQVKDSMIIDYLKKIDIDKVPMLNKGRPVILVQNRNEMYKRDGDGWDIELGANRYPKKVSNRKVIYGTDLKNMKVRKDKEDSDVKKRETKRVLKKTIEEGLSAYELKRLETIKQNQAMLASLNLTNSIPLEPLKNPQQLNEKEQNQDKKIKLLPIRQSRRLKGLIPSVIEDKAGKNDDSAREEDNNTVENGNAESESTSLSFLHGS